MNYKLLLKWIKTNPEVRTITNFCKGVQKNKAICSYYIHNKRPFKVDIIDAYCKKYGFTDKQRQDFFYNAK